MDTLNKTIIISAMLLGAACPQNASAAEDTRIHDVSVAIDEAAEKLTVNVELNPAEFTLKRDGELIFTPVVYSASGTDSLELDPITICGRNRWYWYLRNGQIEDEAVETPTIVRSGSKKTVQISRTVPLAGWMKHSTVELRRDAATCCDAPVKEPGTSPNGNTELARIDTRRPGLIREYVFAPSVDDAPVEKNIEGKAFVSFVVNRTDLNPDYLLNRREIAKIINSIDYVRNDSDAVITDIHIKGFASPEGSYTNNIRLAKGRTATLSDYVRDYIERYFHLDNKIVSNSFEPEDWQGLRTYLTDSLQFDIAHRDEIIAMVDSPIDPDVKNDLIKRTYPADYRVIHKEIYPWLRHSDYTVNYRIKVYTDPATLSRLYATDPTRLRPVDFYTVAGQYAEGSDKFAEVMLKAVEVYAADPMLNLNAASIALMQDDLDRASAHLAKAGDSAEAAFARGVVAARRGHLSEAEDYFTEAHDRGIAKADAYLKNIAEIRDHTSVTITAPITKKD